MPIIVNPVRSAEARGSIGSLTYNTWHGIRYSKARSGPLTQYTARQLDVRNATAQYTIQWQALTYAQRHAWNAYADAHPLQDWTGHRHRLSGYNWWIRCAWAARLMLQTPAPDPPTEPPPSPVLQWQFHWLAGDLYMSWTPDPNYPPNVAYITLWSHYVGATARTPSLYHAQLTDAERDFDGWTYVSLKDPGRYAFWIRRTHYPNCIYSPWTYQEFTIP